MNGRSPPNRSRKALLRAKSAYSLHSLGDRMFCLGNRKFCNAYSISPNAPLSVAWRERFSAKIGDFLYRLTKHPPAPRFYTQTRQKHSAPYLRYFGRAIGERISRPFSRLTIVNGRIAHACFNGNAEGPFSSSTQGYSIIRSTPILEPPFRVCMLIISCFRYSMTALGSIIGISPSARRSKSERKRRS